MKKNNKVLQELREGYLKKIQKETGFSLKDNPKLNSFFKKLTKK